MAAAEAQNKENWQVQLYQEKAALDGKIYKLMKFKLTPEYEALDIEDKKLLTRQFEVMNTYTNVLTQRIARLGPVILDRGMLEFDPKN